jgi:mono/diheme cytochrome c family protein
MNTSNVPYLFLLIILFIIACQGNRYKQGERLYQYYCMSCHMEDGEGLQRLIPPLNNSSFIPENRELLPCIIKYGIDRPIVVNEKQFREPMAGIKDLTETEITNILNYIFTNWDNEFPTIKLQEVMDALENCDQ